MAYDALPQDRRAHDGHEYGFDKIRFIAPVPAGSKIRARFKIAGVTRKANQAVVRYGVSIEIAGGESQCLPRNG